MAAKFLEEDLSILKEDIASSAKERKDVDLIPEKIESLSDKIKKHERSVFIPKFYTYPVITLFILSNVIVFAMMVFFFFQDISHIEKEGYVRFITQPVLMALIAGTVTQTGLAFHLIGKIYSGNKK